MRKARGDRQLPGQARRAARQPPLPALPADNILLTVYREEIYGFNGIRLYRADVAIVCSRLIVELRDYSFR